MGRRSSDHDLEAGRENVIMPTFRVQWEEKSPSAKNPTRKTTQVVADNMFAAKDKARQRIRGNVKVSNMTAVKIG